MVQKCKISPVIQFYIRSILIGFRQNPLATQSILLKRDIWSIQRNVSLIRLIDLMHELRKILFEKLLTSPKERDDKARFLASMSRKEKEHQVVIRELKENLDQKKVEKTQLISKMNFTIIDLQKTIYKMEIDGKNQIERIQHKAIEEIKSIKEAHEETKSKLTTDLNEIKARYNEIVEVNKQNELELRRRKWKLETETENWINKYDSEMTDYQLQYDKLKEEHEAETKSLADLQKIFEPLEKEYLQVLEEQRLIKEKMEAEREEKEALIYWATVIQSFWRAWKTRKAMRKNRRG